MLPTANVLQISSTPCIVISQLTDLTWDSYLDMTNDYLKFRWKFVVCVALAFASVHFMDRFLNWIPKWFLLRSISFWFQNIFPPTFSYHKSVDSIFLFFYCANYHNISVLHENRDKAVLTSTLLLSIFRLQNLLGISQMIVCTLPSFFISHPLLQHGIQPIKTH